MLPISLPNSLGITQLPVFRLAPFRTLAATQAFHLFLCPQLLQHPADHIHADIRAFLTKPGYAKRILHPVNGTKDKASLFSSGDFHPPEAIFKFSVSCLDDKKDVVDIWPRVVFSFVPTVRALFQGFIVPLLVLLDQTLQADV